MHSMVPLKSLVRDRNQMPWLFVCRSWAKVSEFSFAESTLSQSSLGHRGSGFPGLFQQLWGVVLHQTFSRLRWRLSSVMRLTARCFCGCRASSVSNLKAHCRRCLDNFHGKVCSKWGWRARQEVSDSRLWFFSRRLPLTWYNPLRQEILLLA